MIDLRRHVPRVALDWDDVAPGRSWQVLDATMVFADISGFTALTERLATRGRIGAEELIETLNRVFGAMLSEAAIRGGELLKFGGDALLFIFRGDEHEARACRSAVDMRQALKEAAKVPTSVGRLKLSMSVGIHSGPVDLFLVGSPTRELLILGDAGTSTTEAEHAAVAGQILITGGTAVHLPKGSTELRDDGLHRLKWRFAYAPEGEGPPTPEVPAERLRTLFPVALGEYLDTAVPDPEHKIATIGFARFSGTDLLLRERGHDAVAAVLHETLSIFEAAMIEEGITMLATDIDSDGGKLFMGSGVPYATEDDEGSMLRAMRAVIDHGTPLPVQIGVNRGHVFAAEVGTPNRSAYSAMGDTTNTAARIMSKAGSGVLFAHPSVLEQSRTLFATSPAGPFPMKGKAVPVLVYDVGEETGTREAVDRSNLPLVGRDEELAILRGALERALGGEGGVVTVSAATGLGKSRLIKEALRGLKATRVIVRAEPYGMTSPYRMLRDPLRTAFGIERGTPEDMAAGFLSTFRARMPDQLALAPLLSDVVNIPIPETPESRAIDPQFRPERIADLVLRLIERTVDGPFALLVEEGHWADSASITVLNRIASATLGRPWAVIVARRTEGEGYDPGGIAQVNLAPLSDEVMRQIVIDATVDAPIREHEIDGIVARAQGNPLFLEELIRVFREVGSLEAMPDSLHAALDAQIDALDPHSRRILRYASVLGRSFRREVINETLRGDDVQLDDASLAKLREFLEPDGQTRLRFRNSMIRDAAYEGLAYRLRVKLHGAAGRAVEKVSTDLEADADTLSLHFDRAGIAEKTWTYARMAGDRAARAYANVDAATQYQRALEAAKGATEVTDEDRLSVLISRSRVLQAAGMFEEATDSCDRAVRVARKAPVTAASVLLTKSEILIRQGRYDLAWRTTGRAEKMLDSRDGDGPARLLARASGLRVWIRHNQDRVAESTRIAERTIPQARSAGEFDTLVSALMLLDAGLFQMGEATSFESAKEALAIANEHNLLSRAADFTHWLGALTAMVGQWDDAIHYLSRAQDLMNQIGDIVGVGRVSLALGELSYSRGDLDEADAVLEAGRRILMSSGVFVSAYYATMLQARVLTARGRYDEALALAEASEEQLRAHTDLVGALESTLVRAECLTRKGLPDQALALLESTTDVSAEWAAVMRPRALLEKARALGRAGWVDGARAEIAEGLVLAESQKMLFEELRLLELARALSSSLGEPSSDNELRARLDEVAGRLGVEPDPDPRRQGVRD